MILCVFTLCTLDEHFFFTQSTQRENAKITEVKGLQM